MGYARQGVEESVIRNWAAQYAERLVDEEIAARQAADTALQNALQANIDGEALARRNADTALGNRVNEETSARQAADTALESSINTAVANLTELINENKITVDSQTSMTSTNPVQNAVISMALRNKTGGGETINPKLGSHTEYGNIHLDSSKLFLDPDIYSGYTTLAQMAAAIGQGGGSITVDSALSTTSANPVRNSVITTAINEIVDGRWAIHPDLTIGTTYIDDSIDVGLDFLTFITRNSQNTGYIFPIGTSDLTLDSTKYSGYSSLAAMAQAIGQGGGSVTVDSALSGTSTNPVQNKVIKAALEAIPTITVDAALSTTSTNPVQNRIISRALNGVTAITPQLGNDTQYGNIGLTGHSLTFTSTAYSGYSTLAQMAAALSGAVGDITNISNGTTTITPTLGNDTTYGNIALGTHSLTLDTSTYSGFASLAEMAQTLNDRAVVDSALLNSSTHPVQNMVVTKALNGTTQITPYLGDNTTYGDIALMSHSLTLDTTAYSGYSTLAEMASALDGAKTITDLFTYADNSLETLNLLAYELKAGPDGGYNFEVNSNGDIKTITHWNNNLPVQENITKGVEFLAKVSGSYDNGYTIALGSNSVTLDQNTYGYSSLKAMADAIGQGGGSVTVDSALSSSSTNPVQNKVITRSLNGTDAITPKLGNKTSYGDIALGSHSLTLDTSTYSGFASLAAMAAAISGKVDAVSGKGLSTNDFTTALLDKLNGIDIVTSVNASGSIPTSNAVKTFVEGKGYITAISSAEFEELNGGFGSSITVDSVLSATSTNPLQNKKVYEALSGSNGVEFLSCITKKNGRLGIMGDTDNDVWIGETLQIGTDVDNVDHSTLDIHGEVQFSNYAALGVANMQELSILAQAAKAVGEICADTNGGGNYTDLYFGGHRVYIATPAMTSNGVFGAVGGLPTDQYIILINMSGQGIQYIADDGNMLIDAIVSNRSVVLLYTGLVPGMYDDGVDYSITYMLNLGNIGENSIFLQPYITKGYHIATLNTNRNKAITSNYSGTILDGWNLFRNTSGTAKTISNSGITVTGTGGQSTLSIPANTAWLFYYSSDDSQIIVMESFSLD